MLFLYYGNSRFFEDVRYNESLISSILGFTSNENSEIVKFGLKTLIKMIVTNDF